MTQKQTEDFYKGIVIFTLQMSEFGEVLDNRKGANQGLALFIRVLSLTDEKDQQFVNSLRKALIKFGSFEHKEIITALGLPDGPKLKKEFSEVMSVLQDYMATKPGNG